MKHICIIAATLSDYQTLTPLITEILMDESLYLTVVSTGAHRTPEFDVLYRLVEQEGFTVDEKTQIILNDPIAGRLPGPVHFGDLEYDGLLKQLNPDMVILFGSSHETFHAGVCASLHHFPIVHIEGGDSDFRDFDDAFGYGITKLSHLHFTSTEKYRSQVILFGEHPERVFTVGSLLAERVNTLPVLNRKAFYDEMGFEKDEEFLFICLHPDGSLGSKNRQQFQEVLDSLPDESLSRFRFLFNRADNSGLGRMMQEMTGEFIRNHPKRAAAHSFTDIKDLIPAIRYSSAMIGNCPESLVISPQFKTPLISIGEKLQDKEKALNIIDCQPDKNEILPALKKCLSDQFKDFLKDMPSPFEPVSTSVRIKDIVKTFSRRDIARKHFYFVGSEYRLS
jgi:UDP-hydrolysing UDP-N-acetyl-D-glucosamine 2-epimerase